MDSLSCTWYMRLLYADYHVVTFLHIRWKTLLLLLSTCSYHSSAIDAYGRYMYIVPYHD